MAYCFHRIGDAIIGDSGRQSDVSRGFGVASPPIISVCISRKGNLHVMVGGVSNVVIQRLPSGAGCRETVCKAFRCP
jgi:hypothetical protein